jgi:DNA-directed RNA polymerase specialized sigma24 family protein
MSDRTEIAPQEAVNVEISEEMKKKLEALPDSHAGNQGKRWTEEEDAVLLHYWPIKRKRDVAEILGVAEGTARERYNELVGAKE